MLTDISQKYPLSSNTLLQNAARTPPKPFIQTKAIDPSCKENLNNAHVFPPDFEEKIKKYEEELQRNKEKLKEKVIKENKLLDEMNQIELEMVPLLDKINYLENLNYENEEYQNCKNQLEALQKEKESLSEKNEELQKELLKRDDIFKEWNEVVDQLDSKLTRIEGENKELKEEVKSNKENEEKLLSKISCFEKEKAVFLSEKEEFLKEKQTFLSEIEGLNAKIIENEHLINREKEEKSVIIQENNELLIQKDDFQKKSEDFLKENNELHERIEVLQKKNGFLTSRIYELNKEIELCKINKTIESPAAGNTSIDKQMIRPLNSRKSFELLSDSLTLKLNNLEKIFKNEGNFYEKHQNNDKFNTLQGKKQFFGEDSLKKPGIRSISAKREREFPEKEKKLTERRDVKKKMKQEFESDFVKRFKQVITQLEARLDTLGPEEMK